MGEAGREGAQRGQAIRSVKRQARLGKFLGPLCHEHLQLVAVPNKLQLRLPARADIKKGDVTLPESVAIGCNRDRLHANQQISSLQPPNLEFAGLLRFRLEHFGEVLLQLVLFRPAQEEVERQFDQLAAPYAQQPLHGEVGLQHSSRRIDGHVAVGRVFV